MVVGTQQRSNMMTSQLSSTHSNEHVEDKKYEIWVTKAFWSTTGSTMLKGQKYLLLLNYQVFDVFHSLTHCKIIPFQSLKNLTRLDLKSNSQSSKMSNSIELDSFMPTYETSLSVALVEELTFPTMHTGLESRYMQW